MRYAIREGSRGQRAFRQVRQSKNRDKVALTRSEPPYTTRKDWKLTRGAGKKTVYVQYKDAAGNVSAKASDSITYRP